MASILVIEYSPVIVTLFNVLVEVKFAKSPVKHPCPVSETVTTAEAFTVANGLVSLTVKIKASANTAPPPEPLDVAMVATSILNEFALILVTVNCLLKSVAGIPFRAGAPVKDTLSPVDRSIPDQVTVTVAEPFTVVKGLVRVAVDVEYLIGVMSLYTLPFSM